MIPLPCVSNSRLHLGHLILESGQELNANGKVETGTPNNPTVLARMSMVLFYCPLTLIDVPLSALRAPEQQWNDDSTTDLA